MSAVTVESHHVLHTLCVCVWFTFVRSSSFCTFSHLKCEFAMRWRESMSVCVCVYLVRLIFPLSLSILLSFHFLPQSDLSFGLAVVLTVCVRGGGGYSVVFTHS